MKLQHQNIRLLLPIVAILLHSVLLHRFADANYKQLLKDGASQEKLELLYCAYAATVLGKKGDYSDQIAQLAGGPDFTASFLLACLSNGWIVRAVDVDHALSPPAGAWAFSEPGFSGMMRQFPAKCESINCVDMASVDGFEIQSMKLGDSVKAQLYSEGGFKGEEMLASGSQHTLPFRPCSLKVRTPPRIDFITLSDYSSDGTAASFQLHISGANLDEGAVIEIDDRETDDAKIELRVDNSTWLGLGTDNAQAGYSLDPTYYGFPIFHYDSIVTSMADTKIGRVIHLTVTNPDGQQSNGLQYTVPSPETLDSDGDGLLDSWETDGVDGLDLVALGADPYRKDVYVEVDRMIVPGRIWSDFAEKEYPRPEVFGDVETLFRQAPVINPDRSVGIALHIDYGQADFEGTGTSEGGTEIPWKRYIGFKDVSDTHVAASQADQYCNATLLRKNPKYFPASRLKVFRYCIFADQQWNSRSTGGGNKSTIFFLSLGVCRMNAIDHNYQTGVFTHELGHLFGLTHSGDQNGWYNNKPNLNSLMNYLYTFSGQDLDGKIGDIDGEIVGDYVYSYSEGMRAPIDESKLSEVLGVANHFPRDWNRNGKVDSSPVQVMLRDPTYEIPRELTDCAEWSLLRFPIDR